MLKVFVLFLCLFSLNNVSAQWSVGAGGTLTKFAEYRKFRPGFFSRVSYEKPSLGGMLTYHYHVPLGDFNYLILRNGANDSRPVATEVKLNFQALQFMFRKVLVGSDRKERLYAGVGASWLKLKYKEELTEPIPSGYTADRALINNNADGFTIDALLGTEFQMGQVMPFLEAGYSLSMKKASFDRVQNLVPSRFQVQLGVKIPIASTANDQ